MIPFAHGIVGRADLPIPATLFAVAAALVLVVSFVTLAAGWTRPRLEDVPARPARRVPVAVDAALGLIGFAVFAVTVYAGLAGTDIEDANLAPTMIYVGVWIGVPVASLLLGDVFARLSPWRAVGRATGALVGRVAGPEVTEPLPYPERLGRWPAVAGLAAFAFCELCWGDGNDPQVLGVVALVYFVAQLVGMGLYGVDAWSRNGDALGVYFGWFGSLSPLRRPPLAATVRLERPTGTVALACVAIGSTIFDGAKEGPIFSGAFPPLQDFFVSLGLSKGAGLEWAFVLCLAACVIFVAVVYWIGVTGMPGSSDTARAFVHTLVPIVAAYVVAHYFSLIAYNGQSLWRLASDPLGRGSDLFGGADSTIDYGVVSATAIWYVQVTALVVGHVCGLVLAHDRALALYGSARAAVRSQVIMLAVMVVFTVLGLGLLSVSNQ